MVLAMRMAARERRRKELQEPGWHPETCPSDSRCKIVAGVLVKPAERPHARHQEMEAKIGAAAPDEDERQEIGTYDIQEEVRRAHITSADTRIGSRPVVNIVPQPPQMLAV